MWLCFSLVTVNMQSQSFSAVDCVYWIVLCCCINKIFYKLLINYKNNMNQNRKELNDWYKNQCRKLHYHCSCKHLQCCLLLILQNIRLICSYSTMSHVLIRFDAIALHIWFHWYCWFCGCLFSPLGFISPIISLKGLITSVHTQFNRLFFVDSHICAL